MTIVKIAPEWNNAHASLTDVDYILPGWAELPESCAEVWKTTGPFVEITTDDGGNITGMAPSEEILPEPTPDPGPTDKERIAELEEALDLLLSGATGEETEVAANEA